MAQIDDVRAELTGPGGAFEVITTDAIDGRPMKVFKDRFPNLRFVSEVFGAAHADKEFVVYGDTRLTYTEFLAEVNALSAWLAANGVAKGDRVAVLSQNNPQWCAAFWAAVDMGAILVGLNGWWNSEEIVYGLNHSGAKVLVADAKRFERISDELDQVPALEHVLLIDADHGDLEPSGSAAKLQSLSDAVARGCGRRSRLPDHRDR